MLDIKRGDDKTYNLTFTDDNGDPIDITGWTVWFTIKRDDNDPDSEAVALIEQTSHTNPTEGQTTITITKGDSADFEAGTYFFDVQTKNISGSVDTVQKGLFLIIQDVTKTFT